MQPRKTNRVFLPLPAEARRTAEQPISALSAAAIGNPALRNALSAAGVRT